MLALCLKVRYLIDFTHVNDFAYFELTFANDKEIVAWISFFADNLAALISFLCHTQM